MAVASLNLPGYAPARDLDFSSLANLGQVYKQAAADTARRETLAQLGNGDKVDPRVLLASGDLSLANLGVQIQNRQEDQARQERQDAFQREQAAQTQKNWEASHALQRAAAARAAEDKYTIKEGTDANGNPVFYRFKTTGSEGLIPTGAPAPSQPNNPFSAGGKFNEGQGKAAGFTDRMLQSEGILSGIGGKPGVQDQGSGVAGAWGGAMEAAGNAPYVGGVVGAIANNFKGADRQKYEQAKRDFINAQLRRESGAAISPSEFDSANKQYFPAVGDSAEVIAQKAANRRSAIEAMGREGGPSYRPKYVFDEAGRVTPYGKKPSGNVTSSGVKWSVE